MNDATSIESDELSNFRAKKEEFRNLREEAMARERARIKAVCVELEITPEELVGIAVKKRGRKPKQDDVSKSPVEEE